LDNRAVICVGGPLAGSAFRHHEWLERVAAAKAMAPFRAAVGQMAPPALGYQETDRGPGRAERLSVEFVWRVWQWVEQSPAEVGL
jgi:hypothetical protein